ncbi:hypothetical protein Vretimale_17877 [Volvox reticuliferus]|uniref:Uncharacterized protein n=1 Tax=Volvox reticuliferus TaxID=1737510 RepID=A0A8J4GW07_9CHLO|nr:hypothetical protein Vretifemale_1775 [Volvox reticuliferus]GIM14995.1 hypothetical protein Vretimale_17877 [Volvox reticuliferus]
MSNSILQISYKYWPLTRRSFSWTGQAHPATRTRSQRLARRPTQLYANSSGRGGLGDEDFDVAVFRFTLGIPGFDDRLIPRVVGTVLGALLVLNHLAGVQPTPDVQVRSEWVGTLLATLCFFVPDIEERLREAMPGRGRQKTAEFIEGATNCFFLDPSLSEASKKELAWASFSLLKNTNCCGLLVAAGGRVLMVRGAMGSQGITPGDAAGSLMALSEDLAAHGGRKLAEVGSEALSQFWLPERSAFALAGLEGLIALPAGAQCFLAQHIGGLTEQSGLLLVFSERPRALTDRERDWIAAVADKLSAYV